MMEWIGEDARDCERFDKDNERKLSKIQIVCSSSFSSEKVMGPFYKALVLLTVTLGLDKPRVLGFPLPSATFHLPSLLVFLLYSHL